MSKKGITGTDADLAGNLPTSPDAQVRGAEIGRVIAALDTVEITDPAVLAFVNSFKAQAQHVGSSTSEVDVDGPDAGEPLDTDSDEGADVGASGDTEGTEERLDERLTACLKQLQEDFERGIVLIDEKGTLETYRSALAANKKAGKEWKKDIESRLLADNAALLKKAAAMPEGACLVGVHKNGELAIRQRSREIMNARRDARGEMRLLPHAEALALPNGGEWGKVVEILRAVKAAGYHVPADSPSYEKEGLVAASEAVMGGNYVESPVTSKPQDREWRSAILECPDDVADSAYVRVVNFIPNLQKTYVSYDYARDRLAFRGAVLWLRG